MTTFVYNSAAHSFRVGGIDWLTASVRVSLVSGSYSPNPNDQYYSAVPSAAVLANAACSAPGVRANGVCYCTIPSFNAFVSAATVVGLLLYIDTGNPATSPLIYYSSDGIGFPFVGQGFNYSIGYDQGPGGFF